MGREKSKKGKEKKKRLEGKNGEGKEKKELIFLMQLNVKLWTYTKREHSKKTMILKSGKNELILNWRDETSV